MSYYDDCDWHELDCWQDSFVRIEDLPNINECMEYINGALDLLIKDQDIDKNKLISDLEELSSRLEGFYDR